MLVELVRVSAKIDSNVPSSIRHSRLQLHLVFDLEKNTFEYIKIVTWQRLQ